MSCDLVKNIYRLCDLRLKENKLMQPKSRNCITKSLIIYLTHQLENQENEQHQITQVSPPKHKVEPYFRAISRSQVLSIPDRSRLQTYFIIHMLRNAFPRFLWRKSKCHGLAFYLIVMQMTQVCFTEFSIPCRAYTIYTFIVETTLVVSALIQGINNNFF